MARLGDVCTFFSGTGFPNQYQGQPKGKYPFFKVGDISKNVQAGQRTLVYCDNYIDDEIVKSIRGTIIPQNSIVFAKIGEALRLNRRAITPCECLVDNNVMGINPANGILTTTYLYYFMITLDLQKYCESTTVPSVRKSTLEKIEINVPSIDEQNRITAILDKVSDLIALRKQQLALLDELVKARFVEMFGDINVNDKCWITRPLGELCDIYRGGSPRPIDKFLGGTIPWIKIGDASSGDDIFLNSTKEFIIESGVKKSRLIKEGSLIFANCGVSLGFARIITFQGCIHDGWLAFENINEQIDKVFLLKSLNQMTEHFRAIAPAGTQPNLNTSIMKVHQQIVPPIVLQQEYAHLVSQISAQKLTIQRGLDILKVLKDVMMRDYFC